MTVVQLTPSAVGISPDFMRRQAAELARDIVCQLDSAANLAKTYGLSDSQWQVLKAWPAFRRIVQEVNEELGGSAGTLERARRRAALAVAEMGIHDLGVICGDKSASARDKIAAVQLLVDISGASAKVQQGVVAGGAPVGYGGALIQIYLPDGQQLNVGSVPVEEQLPTVIEGQSRRIESDQ